jgi:hypothetical protein
VRTLPVDDLDSVLVKADASVVTEVELGDVDVVALADREHAERVPVPGEHLLHALHHVRRSELGGASRRAEHPQGLVPPPGPAAEHVQVRQGAEVVDVQVGDEDLVELVEGQPGRDVVRHRPFADVEDEVVAVAQLDEDRSVHLARSNERRRSHERDPQLVWPKFLGPGEPVRCARQAGRRADAAEQHSLLPAAHRDAPSQCGLDVGGTGRLTLRGNGRMLLPVGCTGSPNQGERTLARTHALPPSSRFLPDRKHTHNAAHRK